MPSGTPVRQSWYVKREVVVETVCRALHPNDEGPRLVGLLGNSGSGKTTSAAELVRSVEVLELFSDGVLWMPITNDAGNRLTNLMRQLARLVYEDIMGSLGPAPTDACDGAAYVRERMEAGNDGRGLRCLVVADNIWDAAVLAKLRQTGMAVLITTRNEDLVKDAGGVGVRIDTMSEEDAQTVLRGASEIPPGVPLPEVAMELIELCGRVAMDLAFVGRWKTIRGRKDPWAWSNAVAAIRAELKAVEHGTAGDDFEEEARAKRRGAVLRAGFDDLGTEDRRVQELYLALGVMPDSSRIGADDAAVLLYGRKWGGERDDSEAARAVLGVLERWSVLRATNLPEVFQMHDAHSAFARETLRKSRPDILQPALRRWVKHLSSRQAILGLGTRPKNLEWWVGGQLLRREGLGIGRHRRDHRKATLSELWRGVELVGGDSWKVTRPYDAFIHQTTGDEADYISVANKVALFFVEEEEWEEAFTAWSRILGCFARMQSRGASAPVVSSDCSKVEAIWLYAVIAPLRSLGRNLWRAGMHEEADMYWKRGIGMVEATLGQHSHVLAATLGSLGDLYGMRGRLEDQEAVMRRALDIFTRLEDHECASRALDTLAECAGRAGRKEEAKQFLRQMAE